MKRTNQGPFHKVNGIKMKMTSAHNHNVPVGNLSKNIKEKENWMFWPNNKKAPVCYKLASIVPNLYKKEWKIPS